MGIEYTTYSIAGRSVTIIFFFTRIQNSWTYPPFSGHIDEDGKIFARGSQDMKCVGIQYLEAIRRIKSAGIKLKRTLHISFVPGIDKFLLIDN